MTGTEANAGDPEQCGKKIAALSVPVSYMTGAVQRYLKHGIPPGHFLTALFSNDLKGAFASADENNAAAMREWILFMVNEMPASSQGSPERVREWIAMHAARRSESRG